jgi:hypothetical protein
MKVGHKTLIGRLQNSSIERIQNTRVRYRHALSQTLAGKFSCHKSIAKTNFSNLTT